jgi:ABC-type phosphate/phosphonate transport system substrate-binding protein
LGVPVDLVVTADYDHQLASVLAGGLDIAWLPPLLHARATGEGARLAAVPERGGFITCRAAVLVSRGAPFQSLADLRGVRAAWFSRLSSTGHVFPRIDLVSQGVTFSDEAFYDGPDKVFAAVAEGHADLCSCFVSSASLDPARATEEVAKIHGSAASALRVLHVTDLIPPDGIVVAAATSEQNELAIRDALLLLHESAEGQKAVQGLLRAQRLVGVTDALRRMLRSWTELALSRAESPVRADRT